MGTVIYQVEQLLSQTLIGKGRESQRPTSMSNLLEGEHR